VVFDKGMRRSTTEQTQQHTIWPCIPIFRKATRIDEKVIKEDQLKKGGRGGYIYTQTA
jgi:hypothetical protein